jgi:allantoinase
LSGVVTRDFVGYGANPPKVEWPGGALLAVNIAVNFEEGAEWCIEYGDPSCEHRGVDPGGVTHRPRFESGGDPSDTRRDLYTEDQYEYGSGVGFWRLLGILREQEVKATFLCCGKALEMNPAAAAAIAAEGHEAASHGYRWVPHWTLDRDEEREHIRRNVETIWRLTGQRPVGQRTPGASVNTRELLLEEGGFIYDSDTIADDLPYFTTVNGRKWLLVPYANATDDQRYPYPRGFFEVDDFFQLLKGDFDQLYRESARTPKMMSVGLHLRLSGLPGPSNAVERFILHARSFAGVWFARRDEIARIWLEQFGS